MTADLLLRYGEAALRNAEEPLVEASLLRDPGTLSEPTSWLSRASRKRARLHAFDAQNRHFSDNAVCKGLKTAMESHSQKINYALVAWTLSAPEPRDALKIAFDLIFHIKRGREPSMSVR